jgi:hypothetical protein
MSRIIERREGLNTVITIDANNAVTLQNAARTVLGADDFRFT